jgi:hypothetical protein
MPPGRLGGACRRRRTGSPPTSGAAAMAASTSGPHSSLNLRQGPRSDPNGQQPNSDDAAKPFEELGGAHRLALVSLSDGSDQFGLKFRRELERLLIVAGENGHDCALRQRCAFEDDLSVNDGASGELQA